MQKDYPLHCENAVDSSLPPSIQPMLQQPPAASPFDFASFMHRSGGNTTALFSVIREADAHLHPDSLLYTVNVLEGLQCWRTRRICSFLLPDKFARYLYEYHDILYTSVGLPTIQLDRSQISVHSILRPQQVLLMICKTDM